LDERNFKERASRLKQVGTVIEGLPAEIRTAAFELLRDYISSDSAPEKKKESAPAKTHTAGEGDDDREAFFSSFEHEKPADNVKLLAAYLYREYGAQPFKAEEIKKLGDDVGITVPGRVDMTMRQATAEGKKLFSSPARGMFKPTVHGEAYLKKQYSVKKGTKAKPQDET